MKYKLTNDGGIQDEHDAILYASEDIDFLSAKAKRRLAALHTKKPSLQWEGSTTEGRKGSQDYLIEEGLLTA